MSLALTIVRPAPEAEPLLDEVNNVRRNPGVTINVRTFLREFAAFKAKARRGDTVRIRDGEGEFLFTAASARRTILGTAKGRIAFRDDLTKPTLSGNGWKPSL